MEWLKQIEGFAKGTQMCVPESNAMLIVIAGTLVAIAVASYFLWNKVLPTKKAPV